MQRLKRKYKNNILYFVKHLYILLSLIFAFTQATSQIVFPDKIEREHPRLISNTIDKQQINHQIQIPGDVKDEYNKIKNRVAPYVEKHQNDPEWIVSRLQMYWESKATEIYIKGGVYSHADGQAPAPTVRFTGTRDHTTIYMRPGLDEIKPYMDDERGLWLQNKTNQKWEWAEQSKTGRIIESINREIMGLAKNAALVYWVEGDEKYAKFAFDLFDVYMTGIYYRNVPYDLNHGHHQTLAGYTSFEVIHEDIITELVPCYDFLYGYLTAEKSDRLEIYTRSFQKFADQIIKNGVPFNNWNLIQANFVIQIALILENNSSYKDGHGCQYYLDRIFNKTETRQWSITDLIEYGYDKNTGIWAECPGYSKNVAGDFTHIVLTLQEALGIDILPEIPLIPKIIAALPQYLYPNKYIVAFGDTHYSKISSKSMLELVANAKEFDKPDQEKEFTALAKMIDEGEKAGGGYKQNAFYSLLRGNKTVLDDAIAPARLGDYATQTFYAPNVSWLVQRNGLHPKHGLMISQAASLGNHMHANGIAIELYGKGYVLAPEGGIGTSYFQPDYAEYYSQFPAHNTVVVDGISNYPVMKSNHGFEVNAMYPASGRKEGYYPLITFSDVYFLEPETNSDQNRVMSIVRTSESSGYYIDIFRSAKKNKTDKYHDYFYHNLGQKLTLTDNQNNQLELSPSERLTFADGDLFAYDYIWDKQSIKTNKDIKATFELCMEGEENIFMNMWMKGEPGREIFKVMTPPTEAFRREMVTDEVSKSPLPAVVARQTGEAWYRPFAAVYEPSTDSEPTTITNIEPFEPKNSPDGFVGLKIESLESRTDYVFSSDKVTPVDFNEMVFCGTFGLISTEKDKLTFFLGYGTSIGNRSYKIKTSGTYPGAATVVFEKEQIYITADQAIQLIIPDTYKKGTLVLVIGNSEIQGERKVIEGQKTVVFQIPKTPFQQAIIKNKK